MKKRRDFPCPAVLHNIFIQKEETICFRSEMRIKMKGQMQRILHFILVFLILAALIKAFTVDPIARILPSEERIAANSQWKETVGINEEKGYYEYSCQIPESIGEEIVLGINGYHSAVSVLLGQEEIYRYHDEFREQGECWKWIELPENAAGRMLTVRLSYYGSGYAPAIDKTVYLGDKNTVFLKILRENVYVPLEGCIMILSGVVICLGAVILRRKLVTDVWKGIAYLGTYIFIAGIWLITDSDLMQFITGRVAVIELISFISFMLMPYFLLRFIGKMMIYRKKEIIILGRLHLAYTAVCIFLYLFRIASLQQTLLGVHILIVVSIAAVLKIGAEEIRKYNNREMKMILAGLAALIAFGGIAFGFFFSNIFSPYSLFYGIGILLFGVCLVGAALERLRYYLVTSAKAAEYREIAHKDIMTQMGNRVAFTKQQETGTGQKNKGCIVLDINNLKNANDEYGHQEGDKLIVDAAKCILEAFAGLGWCYRVGGDEFAVILNTVSEEKIRAGIQRFEQILEEQNKGRKIPIEIAYGYAIQRDRSLSSQDLFNEADAQMYAKKLEMKAKKNIKLSQSAGRE